MQVFKSINHKANVLPEIAKKAVIVEFTGVTGVGKTTLVAAVIDVLSDQGVCAGDAYDVILGSYGFNFVRHPQLRSGLVDLLVFLPFLRYISTRAGLKLLRLAVRVIKRDAAGTLLVAANLLRNFAKRIGVHVLLMKLRHRIDHCDFIICDEGILHTAHNLFVHTNSAPDPKEIVRFASLVPKPDIVVWVKATKERSIECTLQRGHARVDASLAAAQAFVEHGYLTFDVLCSLESIRDKLFVVDNSPGSEANHALPIQDRAYIVAEFLKYGCTVKADDA